MPKITRYKIEKALNIRLKPSDKKSVIMNQAIDLEKNVIFIAIPKTGTTSVREQLDQKGNPIISNAHLNIMQIRDLIYIYLLKMAVGTNKSFPTTGVPTDQDLRVKAAEIFQSCFKFSAVRNPWARAVSMYFRSDGIGIRKEMSFEQFCEAHKYASDTCLHPTLHKNQLDWLCDENGENLMDYVYKVEDFETAIDEINQLTNGRLGLKNQELNSNRKSKSKSYHDVYNDHTRKLIAQAFEKDIDTFKYTF